MKSACRISPSTKHELVQYGTASLLTVPGLRLIGTAREKASVLSFVLDSIPPEEVGKALDQEGIAVRSGHHCAQTHSAPLRSRENRAPVPCPLQHPGRHRRTGGCAVAHSIRTRQPPRLIGTTKVFARHRRNQSAWRRTNWWTRSCYWVVLAKQDQSHPVTSATIDAGHSRRTRGSVPTARARSRSIPRPEFRRRETPSIESLR